MILYAARMSLLFICFFIGSFVLLILMLLGRGDGDGYFYAHHLMPRLVRWMGVRIELRGAEHLLASRPCVFVANHQSIFDVIIHGAIIPPGTITIGKKSIRFIPIFGWIFVLSRCILIDRKRRQSALESMSHAADEMLRRQKSVWVFAEGTRSGTRGLLPFKKGAFYLAVQSKRPVVSVVASSYFRSFDLRKWNAGTVIIDVLPPVATSALSTDQVPALLSQVHADFERTLRKINEDVELRRG